MPYGDNLYELVMLVSYIQYEALIPFLSTLKCHNYHIPSLLNISIDNVDGYASSDLLQPHPTKPGYWRVYGRTDDQIMHSTGEKVRSSSLLYRTDFLT